MPEFNYRVRDKQGKLITGCMHAESQDVLVRKLKSIGYAPIFIEQKRRELNLFKFLERGKKVKLADLNLFSRQMVTLLKAGLPLFSSLEAVKEQTQSKLLKEAIEEVISDIKAGNNLSQALSKHPNCFDELYVNMVASGETGGILDEVLERLATLGEHEEDTRARIKTAIRYPIIVVSALVMGFLILVTFVLPRFSRIFAKFKTALPLPTQIMLKINYLFSNYWYFLLIFIILGFFIFRKYISTKSGKKILDKLKLKFPIFGPLSLKITMSRFTRITAILTRSGLPILQVLDLVSRIIGNSIIEKAIKEIRNSVNEGKNIAEPMRANKLFPPIVVQMVSIGEETGKLDDLLLRVSDYYDSQIDYTIKNLSTLLEPILLLILGCGVLFMALAIFLPMWNLMSLFKH